MEIPSEFGDTSAKGLCDTLALLDFDSFLVKFTKQYSISPPEYKREDLFEKSDHNSFFTIIYFILAQLDNHNVVSRFKGLIPCRDHKMMGDFSKLAFGICQDLMRQNSEMQIMVCRPLLVHFITPRGEKIRSFLSSIANYTLYRRCKRLGITDHPDLSNQDRLVTHAVECMDIFKRKHANKETRLASWTKKHEEICDILDEKSIALDEVNYQIQNLSQRSDGGDEGVLSQPQIRSDIESTCLRAGDLWRKSEQVCVSITDQVQIFNSLLPVIKSSTQRADGLIDRLPPGVTTDKLVMSLARHIKTIEEELSKLSVKSLYKSAYRLTENAGHLSRYMHELYDMKEQLLVANAHKKTDIEAVRKQLLADPLIQKRVDGIRSILPPAINLEFKPTKRPTNMRNESRRLSQAKKLMSTQHLLELPAPVVQRRWSILEHSFHFTEMSTVGYMPQMEDSIAELFTPPKSESGSENNSRRSSRNRLSVLPGSHENGHKPSPEERHRFPFNTSRSVKSRFSMPANVLLEENEPGKSPCRKNNKENIPQNSLVTAGQLSPIVAIKSEPEDE